jgi:alkylated DNA repair dioxygenase AlkB
MIIPGLKYIPYSTDMSFLFDPNKLWAHVYDEDWCYDIKRRTQHYGFKYDYKLRRISESERTKEFPKWLENLRFELQTEIPCLRNYGFDQCIVNEYLEGQAIAPHIDCQPCFEDTIVTLSLGAEYTMDFRNWKTKQTKKMLLGAGSVLILSGESRYDWTHALKPQKGTRVSITFRKVILD